MLSHLLFTNIFFLLHVCFDSSTSCTSPSSLFLRSSRHSMALTWDDVNDNIFIHHSVVLTVLPKNKLVNKHNQKEAQWVFLTGPLRNDWQEQALAPAAVPTIGTANPPFSSPCSGMLHHTTHNISLFVCLSSLYSGTVSLQVNTIVLVSPTCFRGRCAPIRLRVNHFLMNSRLLLHMKTISARAMWNALCKLDIFNSVKLSDLWCCVQ